MGASHSHVVRRGGTDHQTLLPLSPSSLLNSLPPSLSLFLSSFWIELHSVGQANLKHLMLLLQLLSLPSAEVRGLYRQVSIYFLSIKKKLLQVRFDIAQNVIDI